MPSTVDRIEGPTPTVGHTNVRVPYAQVWGLLIALLAAFRAPTMPSVAGLVALRHGQSLHVAADGQPGGVDDAQVRSADMSQQRHGRHSQSGADKAAHHVVVVGAVANPGCEARPGTCPL